MMAVTALPVEAEPAGLAEVDLCSLELNIKYEVLQAAICSACLTFGLTYCFFGYRCFRMVMFFSGFLASSGAVLLLYQKGPVLGVHLAGETKGGVSLAAGLLCGLMASLLSTLGLLLSGLLLGALLSLGVLVALAQLCSSPSAWAPPAVLLSASVLSAMVTLQWKKLFSIVYTSVFGAAAVTLCVDFMLGAFILPDQVFDLFCQVTPRPLYWYHWVIAALCPVLSFTGGLVQWTLTARGLSHREDLFPRRKKISKKYKNKDPRRRPPHYRRRRPPPLKRYTGDVLAPSYLQSLQERHVGTSSSTSSSSSSVTHTLIDFDFETGSMVPLTGPPPVYSV